MVIPIFRLYNQYVQSWYWNGAEEKGCCRCYWFEWPKCVWCFSTILARQSIWQWRWMHTHTLPWPHRLVGQPERTWKRRRCTGAHHQRWPELLPLCQENWTAQLRNVHPQVPTRGRLTATFTPRIWQFSASKPNEHSGAFPWHSLNLRIGSCCALLASKKSADRSECTEWER